MTPHETWIERVKSGKEFIGNMLCPYCKRSDASLIDIENDIIAKANEIIECWTCDNCGKYVKIVYRIAEIEIKD